MTTAMIGGAINDYGNDRRSDQRLWQLIGGAINDCGMNYKNYVLAVGERSNKELPAGYNEVAT